MSEAITWSLNVDVDGGPDFREYQRTPVGAYDIVSVVVPGDPAGGGNVVTVQVQPLTSAADVKFLMIRSSRYGEDLTWDNGGTDVPLDAPCLLAGGALLLLAAAPTTLEFTNGFGVGNDVEVTILVGREAST